MATPTRSSSRCAPIPARAAILCDIDGTLAPIVDDPEAARCPPEAREVLAELADRYRARRLRQRSPRERRAAHGRPRPSSPTPATTGSSCSRPGDAEPAPRPRARPPRQRPRPAFVSRLDWDDLDRVGLRLEDKGPIQAIHWRGAADPRDRGTARRARSPRSPSEQGLVAAPGPDGARAAAAGDGRQGDRRAPADRRRRRRARALFGGDDRTDLDAFAALRELARRGRARSTRSASGSPRPRPRPRSSATPTWWSPGHDGFLELLRSALRCCSATCCGSRSLLVAGVATALGAVSVVVANQDTDEFALARRGGLVDRRGGDRRLARAPGAGGGGDRAAARRRAHRDQPAVGEPGPDRVHAAVADRRLRAAGRRSPAASRRRSPRSAPATRS